MGVELFLLISALSIVLMMTRTGSAVTNDASTTSVNVSKSMLNYGISKYDNATVNGGTLRSLIEQHGKEKDVYINSKLCTFGNRSTADFKLVLNTLGGDLPNEVKTSLVHGYKNVGDLDSTSIDKNFGSIYYDDSEYYLGDSMMFQIRIIYDNNEEFQGIYAKQV